MADIIDLTKSPPLPAAIEISSGEELPCVGQQKGPRKHKHRKKKRSKGPITTSGVDFSARPSRDHSQERGSNSKLADVHESPHELCSSPPNTSAGDSEFFFIDTVASRVEASQNDPEQSLEATGIPTEHASQDAQKLLLPSHVSLMVSTLAPIQVIPPPTVDSDDNCIEYLDYMDGKDLGLTRYFAAEANEAGNTKPSIFKCKHCGAEGDHKSSECTVLICLTCGARDEHSTRSCPISKTCYTCGMKGHINKTCPNRHSRSTLSSELHGDCDRCGLSGHRTNECPTLWRIYHYVNDEERILIKKSREQSKQLLIGEGGEGYIAHEEWCYNCANSGHLGDDCDELPRPWGTLDNPSAFGAYNMMSGPFYDPSTEPARIRRGPRDPHADWSLLPDNLNLNIPVDVGKRGRNKDREKLEKRLRDQEDNDVDGDWFTSRNTKNPGINELPPPRGRSVKFGSSLKDRIVKATPLSLGSVKPPSLLDRIGGSFDTDQHRHRDRGKPTDSLSLRIRGAADDRKHHDSRYSPKYDRHRERYRRDRDKDRDRSRDRGSDRNHGPQYKGGYSR